MKCELITRLGAGPTCPDELTTVDDHGTRWCEPGTVLDHPDAWRLVHGGHAVAADDECRDRVALCSEDTAGLLRRVHDGVTAARETYVEERRELRESLEEEEWTDDPAD